MFNQLALNSNTYHGYSIEEAIIGASRAGFKKIELAAVKDHTAHVRPETPQSEIKRIKSLLKEKDIEVIGISAHSNVLTVEGIANLLETIELSVMFNCRYIVTATGDSHGDRDVIKENSQLKEKLAVVIEKCRKLNKQLVIETHGNNYATGESLQQFIHTLDPDDQKYVQINYDTGNVLFYGQVEPYEDLQKVVEDVTFIHLKDKKGAQDEWNFPAIGDGEFNFERIFSILKTHRFKGPISVEIEFTPEGPASLKQVDQAVKRSYEFLEEVLI